MSRRDVVSYQEVTKKAMSCDEEVTSQFQVINTCTSTSRSDQCQEVILLLLLLLLLSWK